MSSSTGTDLQSFDRFSHLPLEMRELIWGFCLPGPRTFDEYSDDRSRKHEPVVILEVNEESRAFALKSYDFVLYNTVNGSGKYHAFSKDIFSMRYFLCKKRDDIFDWHSQRMIIHMDVTYNSGDVNRDINMRGFIDNEIKSLLNAGERKEILLSLHSNRDKTVDEKDAILNLARSCAGTSLEALCPHPLGRARTLPSLTIDWFDKSVLRQRPQKKARKSKPKAQLKKKKAEQARAKMPAKRGERKRKAERVRVKKPAKKH